jgi:hypothetical protein
MLNGMSICMEKGAGMVIGERRISQIISALGSLLCFAGPARPYPVVKAESITSAAWSKTGSSLSAAMAAFDGKTGQPKAAEQQLGIKRPSA